MRAQLGSGEVTLRRWREQDAAALYRLVLESIEHLRPWMAWVADGYPPEAAATARWRGRPDGADRSWRAGRGVAADP